MTRTDLPLLLPLSLPASDKTGPARINCVCVLIPSDLFSLFASESGGYAARDDMETMLRAVDGEVPPSLRKCFSEVSPAPHRAASQSPIRLSDGRLLSY